MHCRSLELSITLATHFSAKKVPIHPKPFSFHVQNSLYSAIPLTTPTDCCLNLVSCTTQMPSELRSNISTISPDLPLRVLTLTMQTHKSRNSFSWWCSPWMITLKSNNSPTMYGIFSLKCSYPFAQFSLSILFVISKIRMCQTFITGCPSWHQTSIVVGNSIFIKTSSLDNCQSRLKSSSPAHKIEIISGQALKPRIIM